VIRGLTLGWRALRSTLVALPQGARSDLVLRSQASLAALTCSSGIATTFRQSLHVQQVNLRIHVPCPKAPEATRALEPQSGQAVCSFMSASSAVDSPNVERVCRDLDDRHDIERRSAPGPGSTGDATLVRLGSLEPPRGIGPVDRAFGAVLQSMHRARRERSG
jgi:hypothetical protein